MSLDVATLAGLRMRAEWTMMEKRADGSDWRRAWRQRDRWNPRWEAEFETLYSKTDSKLDLPVLVSSAQKAWGGGMLKKARKEPPPWQEIANLIDMDVDEKKFEQRAMTAYVKLAAQEGEEAAQHTLDALGLNVTFSWAGLRDFAMNPFAIRGSKVIQALYGNHREKLARMVIAKCKPDAPKSIGQLVKEIRAEWTRISKYDAKRVARTEAANVWETANWNAMYANGVNEVEWLIATGPSIGPPKSYPVCKECLEMAAESPWVMEDMEKIAPLHPFCRCTVVQKYDPLWLPPAQPWTGAARPLEVFV